MVYNGSEILSPDWSFKQHAQVEWFGTDLEVPAASLESEMCVVLCVL